MEENKVVGIHPLKGTIQVKSHRHKIGNALKGFIHSEQSKLNMGRGQIGKTCKQRPEVVEKRRTTLLAKRESIRETSLKQWSDPAMREKMIRAILTGSHKRPTKAEIELGRLIEEVCPDEYEYTGDGSVVIAGLVPDYTNKNGQKKVIEMFGEHWHERQNPQNRINKFAVFGYKCLIIWESELGNPSAVLDKIREFSRGEEKSSPLLVSC